MIAAQATAKYVRTSAQKAGLVLELIRGRDVNHALSTLRFSPKRSSFSASKPSGVYISTQPSGPSRSTTPAANAGR